MDESPTLPRDDGLAVAIQDLWTAPASGLCRKTSTREAGGTFISPLRLRMAVMVSMTRRISASAAGLSSVIVRLGIGRGHDGARRPRQLLPDLFGDEGDEGVEQP